MLLSKRNIERIIADRGIERFIDNTEKVIKAYTKNKGSKQNENTVKRYARLLSILNKIKSETENGI